MFGRRKQSRSPGQADPDLPLDVDDAAHVRSLLAQALAEAGREVTIEGDRVLGADGVEFGLWNVAAMCAREPRRHWPEVVQAHVAGLVSDLGPEELTEEDVRTQLHERIQGADQLPDPSWFPSATVLSDVLVSIPVLDTPTQVATVAEDRYDAVGGLDRWRDHGRAATRRLLDTEQLEHAEVGAGSGIHLVMGDSFFTASLALHVPELLARFGVSDHGRGTVVAVPFRHQVAFHPVRGPESVGAIQQLFGLALRNFAESPGGVTPHLHLVRDGSWTRITMLDDAEAPGIVAGPELVAALEG